MRDIVPWIVFALVVGVGLKLIMPERDTGGLVLTIVLAIVGGMVGAFYGRPGARARFLAFP